MTNSMFGQGQKRVCSWDYSHSSDPKKIRLNYSESQSLDDIQRLRHGPVLERSRNNQYVAGICKGKMETSAFNNGNVQRMQQVRPSFSDKAGTSQMAPYKETNTISGIILNSQNSFSLDKSISEQRMLPRQSVGLQKGEGQFKTSEPSHQRQSVTSFKLKQDDNSSQGGFSGFSQGNFNADALPFNVHNSCGSSFDSRMQPFQLNTSGKYDKESSHRVDNPGHKGSSQCLDGEASERCDSQYDKHSSQWNNPSSQPSSQHGQSYKESDSLYGKKRPEWNEDSSCQQNLQYKDSCKRYVSWYCEKPPALNVDPSNWPDLQYKASFLKYDGRDGEKPSQRIDDSNSWQSSQYGDNSKKYGSRYSENHPECNDDPQSQSSQYDVTYNKCDTGCVERLLVGNDLPSGDQSLQYDVNYKRCDTEYSEKLTEREDVCGSHQCSQYGVSYKRCDTGYGEKLPDRNDVCSSHQSSQYGVNYKRCDTGYGEKLPDRNDVCNNKRCDRGYGEKLSDRNDVCSSHHSLQYDVNYKRCDTRYGERLPERNEVYSSHQRSQYDVSYKRCDTEYGDKLPDRNEFPSSNQGQQYGDGDKKYDNQDNEKPSKWKSNPSVHQISQSGDSCKKSCSQNRESKEPSDLQNVAGGTPETSYEKLKLQSGVPLENIKEISPSTRSSSKSSQSISKIGDSHELVKFDNRNETTKTQDVQEPLEKTGQKTVQKYSGKRARRALKKLITKLNGPGVTNMPKGMDPKSVAKVNHLQNLQKSGESTNNSTKNNNKQSGISPKKFVISEKIRKFSSFLRTFPDQINPVSTLHIALKKSKTKIRKEYRVDRLYHIGSNWTSVLRLGGVVIFRTFGNSKKALKQYTHGEAIRILKTKSVDDILSHSDVGSKTLKNEFRQLYESENCRIAAPSEVAGKEMGRKLLTTDTTFLNQETIYSFYDANDPFVRLQSCARSPNDPFERLQSCARSQNSHFLTPSKCELGKLKKMSGCYLKSCYEKKLMYQEKKPQLFYRAIYFLEDIPIGLGENVSNMETAKQCFQMALKNILEMPCEKLKAGISIEDNRKLIEVPLGYSRKQSLCEKLDRLIQFAKLTCFTNDGLIDNINKVIKSIPLNASVLFTPSEVQQNQIICDFYINGTYIASGQDSDRNISQQKAYKTAWTTLGSSQASDFTRAKLIIFESTRLSKKRKETAFSIINTSALMCGVKFECTCKRNPTGQTGAENNYIAEIFIGDELIATNYGENEKKAKNNVGFTVWQKFSETHPVIQIVSDLEADAANWITYEEIVRKSKEMVTGRMYFPSYMQKSTQVILDFINELAERETIRQLIIAPDMPKCEKHEILQYIKNMPYLQLEKRSSEAGKYTVIFWKSLTIPFILDALKDSSNIKSARYRYAPYSISNSKVGMDVSSSDSSNI